MILINCTELGTEICSTYGFFTELVFCNNFIYICAIYCNQLILVETQIMHCNMLCCFNKNLIIFFYKIS